MLIKFNGNPIVIRQWEPYRWGPENGHVAEVEDAAALAEMLTGDSDFVIAPGEPLLQWMTAEQAATLVLYGDVATVADLANLEKARVKKVAEQLGETQSVINAWVKQASQYVKEPPAEAAAATDAGAPTAGG